MTTILEAVPPLNETELRRMPRLTRAERLTELERLAHEFAVGTRPSENSVRVQLSAYAHARLRPAEIRARWSDVLAEYERWVAVEADEPFWADLQPGLAKQDLKAALGDLIDGTDRYRGDRR